MRGRPIITPGASIHTDTGVPLRGASMDIRKQTNPVCTQASVWANYRAAGLNVCRIDVKTDVDGNGRPIAQQLPFLDAAVDAASAAHMYIQPHPSVMPGNYNLSQLNAFWTAVAPRYASRTHVIYEMYNEPTANVSSPYYGNAASWTTVVLTDFRGAFNIIRNAAPDSPVVIFSTANLAPNSGQFIPKVNQFVTMSGPAVDWTKTVMGYHHYLGTYNFGGTDGFGGIGEMMSAGFAMYMTECNDFMGDGSSNDPRNHTQVWLEMEQFQSPAVAGALGHGIGWNCLDGKGGTITTQITSKILPALHAAGIPTPPDA